MKTRPGREHRLFQEHPISGAVPISTGVVPVPYHVYNGVALFIGGYADLGAAQGLLLGQDVTPVQTTDGRALMAVWVCDFTDASLGAHRELQFSIFCARQPIHDIPPHPFAILKLMIQRPEVGMFCHGLWNDTLTAVAYNRELLGLDARLSHGAISVTSGQRSFQFTATASGQVICSGAVRERNRTSLAATLALGQLFGFGAAMSLARLPWIAAHVVNPISDAVPHNGWAPAFNGSDKLILDAFDPASDSLHFHDPDYEALRFQPQFVELMQGFRFVYLQP